MLINCVAYQNGRKLGDIPIEDISEYVSRPDCFVWVALFEPSPDEMALMAEEFGLHELAVEDAQKGHQRPKIEEYGDVLFGVLHTLERHPDDAADFLVGEVAVFAGPNFVLSVRRGSQQGFGEVRRRAEREPDHLALGSGFVLYALMDAVVDRYFPVLDDLEEELDALEGQIFRATPTRANIETLLRPQVPPDGAEPRRRPADGRGGAAVRRPGARRLRGHAGLLPRRLRPPGAPVVVHQRPARNAADRDPGQPRR